MTTLSISRRKVLMGAGALSAGTLLSSEVGPLLPGRAQAQSLPVRRDVATLRPNDPILQSLREAVVRCMQMSQSDPRHWRNIAGIHDTFCPHLNWFFLPWHRAYLHMFEVLVRELADN